MPDALDRPKTDAPPPLAPLREGPLTDIFLAPTTWRERRGSSLEFALFLLLASVAIVMQILIRGGATPWISLVTVALFLGGIIALERHTRRAVRRFAGLRSKLDATSFMLEFFRRRPEVRLAPSRTHQLALAMGRHGCVDDTVRLVSPFSYAPIRPLEVEFEPHELDESNTGFQALERHLSQAESHHSAASGSLRWLRRNVALAGGWGAILVSLLILSGLTLLAQGVRGLSNQIAAWGIWTLVALFFSTSAIRRSVRQFLILPGGLVVRRSSWFGARWRVKLYDRRQAVLIARELPRGTRWMVTVADRESAERVYLTRPETDLLLAAWLSPIPPPPIERLSDLEH